MEFLTTALIAEFGAKTLGKVIVMNVNVATLRLRNYSLKLSIPVTSTWFRICQANRQVL